MVPWVQVACKKYKEKDEILKGKLFCFLPISCFTGTSIHINGYFELSINRRDLWLGSEGEVLGENLKKVKWNER